MPLVAISGKRGKHGIEAKYRPPAKRRQFAVPEDFMVAFADGLSRGNPGPAAFGVYLPAGDLSYGEVLPQPTTNVVAEYRGAIHALKMCKERGARAVELRLDSQLVVWQVSPEYQVKNEILKPLVEELRAAIKEFDQVRCVRVYRERNVRADKAANDALAAYELAESLTQ